ncbi:hypothetical protein PybrP1_008402 [[Pythium] brassicae (nom. inval.)]|nr:hypothetical protein PybrP1_008402 [[Pythium] brassicae (nom. inval.)]
MRIRHYLTASRLDTPLYCAWATLHKQGSDINSLNKTSLTKCVAKQPADCYWCAHSHMLDAVHVGIREAPALLPALLSNRTSPSTRRQIVQVPLPPSGARPAATLLRVQRRPEQLVPGL